MELLIRPKIMNQHQQFPPRSSKPNNNIPIIICKKHPKHQQSPGVCSICLSEKLSHHLSKLNNSSRTKNKLVFLTTASKFIINTKEEEEEENSSCSSSSLSNYSPSQCSSCVSSPEYCSSPIYDPRRRRMAASRHDLIRESNYQLLKSRSIASAAHHATRRINYRERLVLLSSSESDTAPAADRHMTVKKKNDNDQKKKKMTSHFWSKLLLLPRSRPHGKRFEEAAGGVGGDGAGAGGGLVHSRSMRDHMFTTAAH